MKTVVHPSQGRRYRQGEGCGFRIRNSVDGFRMGCLQLCVGIIDLRDGGQAALCFPGGIDHADIPIADIPLDVEGFTGLLVAEIGTINAIIIIVGAPVEVGPG